MSEQALERFHRAQDSEHAGFASALAELQAGRKRGHWIWYIFPQLAGLGRSSTAQTFALADLHEAEDYAKDPVLSARLVEISRVVAARLRQNIALVDLLGSEIDAQKLVSSMTLFETVAERLYVAERNELHRALASIAKEILGVAEAQGYPRCQHTLDHLRANPVSAS